MDCVGEGVERVVGVGGSEVGGEEVETEAEVGGGVDGEGFGEDGGYGVGVEEVGVELVAAWVGSRRGVLVSEVEG